MSDATTFCERRNELAESLVDVSVRVSIAAVEMARAAGLSESSTFLKAKAEVEGLRNEIESIRAELSHHRLKHGC